MLLNVWVRMLRCFCLCLDDFSQFGALQFICSFDTQVYGAIASTLSSMGLSVVLDHAIEENLIHIPVALLHSRSALQLDEAVNPCSNDATQLCGSAILQGNALQNHGWKVGSLLLMPQTPDPSSCSSLARCKPCRNYQVRKPFVHSSNFGG